MVFEHFAINVKDVEEVVKWYCTNLGLMVVSEQKEPPFMTFLADRTNRVVLELYSRDDASATEFGTQHPLTFHVAFVSDNAEEDKIRLMEVGATFFEEIIKEDGSHLVMLRDPWGMPLQLCQRNQKF